MCFAAYKSVEESKVQVVVRIPFKLQLFNHSAVSVNAGEDAAAVSFGLKIFNVAHAAGNPPPPKKK